MKEVQKIKLGNVKLNIRKKEKAGFFHSDLEICAVQEVVMSIAGGSVG